MLKDYPSHTFTPEKPELSINFITGMKLTLVKFIMSNDLDFITTPSLGFQVQIGDTTYPVRSFVSFVSAIQKDSQVIEINMPFQTQEDCIAKIKITDQKQKYEYSIAMVYDIQPLEA